MVETANSFLAMCGAMLLFNTVSKMDARTCHTVRIGVTLLFCGMLGDFLSIFLPGWGTWVTTLQYLGIICFLAADRRRPPPLWATYRGVRS